MDLGGGDVDVLIEENGNVTHPITLSLDENGGMGNSSVSPHSRDEDMQPSTQPSTQLTADDSSKDAEKLDAATAATETDTTATAGPDTTAADAAAEKMDEAAAKTDAAAEPKTTNGDAADKPAADSVTNTAKSGRTSASALPMLAPPHTAPPAPSKGSSAATSAKFPTSSTSPTVPHGSTEWEVERLVEQRESKGHIWFRVKWKEFNTMTWEEEKNLHDCEQLIKEFREKAGLPTTDTDRNRDGDRDGGDEEGDDGQGNEEKEEGEEGGTEDGAVLTRGRRGRKRKSESNTTAATRKRAASGRAAAAAAGGKKGKARQKQPGNDAEDEGAGKGEQPAEDADEEAAEEDGDVDEAPEYEVESIISHLVDDDGVTFYEVKWKGYKKPTWEPEANLVGCDELLAEYKEAHVSSKHKGKQKKGRGRPAKKATAAKAEQTEADHDGQQQQQQEEEEGTEMAMEAEEAVKEKPRTNGKSAEQRGRRRKVESASELPEDSDETAGEEKGESADRKEEEEKSTLVDKRQARAGRKTSSAAEEVEERKEVPRAAAATAKHKGGSSKAGSKADSGDEEADDSYEVELIMDVDEDPTDSSEPVYLVKWKGWPATSATWEPASSFDQPNMVEEFRKERALPKSVNSSSAEWKRPSRTVERVRVR